jgi:hypothetical protein
MMDERIKQADDFLLKHGWQRVNFGWERSKGGYGYETIVQIEGPIYGYVGAHPPGSGISNIEVIGATFGPEKGWQG